MQRMRSRAAARAQRPPAPPPATITLDGVDHRIRPGHTLTGEALARLGHLLLRGKQVEVLFTPETWDWEAANAMRAIYVGMVRLLVPTLPYHRLTFEQLDLLIATLLKRGYTQ